MRHVVLASSLIAAAGVWVACSSSSNNNPPPAGDGGASSGGDSGSSSPFTLAVPCNDTIDSIYGDPGTLPADKGAIIKCAVDGDIAMADLQSRLDQNFSLDDPPAQRIAYSGKPMTSGAHVYRILYRTERGDTNSSPGYSSAKVFIPDTPRKAGPMPMIVGARGSRGQAPNCTASKEDPSAPIVNPDYEGLAFPMVGLGFPIIVSDLAGYANFGAPGNPISGYAQYQDVAKGTLDSARALAKMFPNAFSGKVVLIGHSQGGHSALASLALQPTYAPDVSIAAVALYSPLWISQRSWGALFFEPGLYPLATSPSPTAVSLWYHYTHGELLDGPGHGLDMIAADKKAVVQQFMNHDCWYAGWDGSDAGTAYPELQAAGSTVNDFYDPAFIASVKNPAALGSACAAGDDVCTKWMQRYEEDRPSLSNVPPLLIEYGDSDDTIAPGLMACVIDRLKNQDKVPYTFCLNRGVGHMGVLRQQASNVADWIASITLGEPAPPACALTDANLVNDAGALIACQTPPPNK